MRQCLLAAALLPMLLVLPFLPAAAGQTDEVEALLKSKIDSVLSILSQVQSTEKKRQQIMETISPVIDFPLMAKLSLGKSNWQRLDADQQKRFVDLFVARLKSSYLEKTSLYSDQEVVYEQPAASQGKVHIPTRIITKDKRVKVIYKFYRTGSGWQVYDIEIEGVSFIKSYRSQFNEILRNGNVSDLFASLEKSVGKK
ncbi:MAG: phospholipid-binding protein MlaC [Desulfosudaceae bacterium]